jgi:DNA-binding CsgD family transcriptional regulator
LPLAPWDRYLLRWLSQYVKRIYRKLDVPSRVALTRLLLDLRGASRRD